jgi:hypothetical protein
MELVLDARCKYADYALMPGWIEQAQAMGIQRLYREVLRMGCRRRKKSVLQHC